MHSVPCYRLLCKSPNLSDTCQAYASVAAKKFPACEDVRASDLNMAVPSYVRRQYENGLFYKGCLNPHLVPIIIGGYEQVIPITIFFSHDYDVTTGIHFVFRFSYR